MSTLFSKWDIVYPLRYPEAIQCSSCGNYLTINSQQECSYCHKKNNVSNIIAKIRPMILWIDQSNWYKSMAFGIPLSTTGYFTDSHNQAIKLSDCIFFEKRYEKPMRAILCQATRADGCVIERKHLVGKLTNQVIRNNIENKLFTWLFG